MFAEHILWKQVFLLFGLSCVAQACLMLAQYTSACVYHGSPNTRLNPLMGYRGMSWVMNKFGINQYRITVGWAGFHKCNFIIHTYVYIYLKKVNTRKAKHGGAPADCWRVILETIEIYEMDNNTTDDDREATTFRFHAECSNCWAMEIGLRYRLWLCRCFVCNC